MQKRMKCPCGTVLSIRPEWKGRKIRCPTCKMVLTAPGAASRTRSPTPASLGLPGTWDQVPALNPLSNASGGFASSIPPRRKATDAGFRLTPKEIVSLVGISLVALFFVVLPLFVSPSEKSRRVAELDRNGEYAHGPLISKSVLYSRRGGLESSYVFFVDYTPESGLTRFGKQFNFHDREFYDRYSVGDEVPVLYDPDDPDISKLDGAGVATPFTPPMIGGLFFLGMAVYVSIRFIKAKKRPGGTAV